MKFVRELHSISGT